MASRHGPGFSVRYILYGLGLPHLRFYPVVIEGLVTVVAGAVSFWIIQDFPDTARFLTEVERTAVVRRLQEDDQFSAAGEQFKMKYIWQSFADWKTWLGSTCPLMLSQGFELNSRAS